MSCSLGEIGFLSVERTVWGYGYGNRLFARIGDSCGRRGSRTRVRRAHEIRERQLRTGGWAVSAQRYQLFREGLRQGRNPLCRSAGNLGTKLTDTER